VGHFFSPTCEGRAHFGKADPNDNNVRGGAWVPQNEKSMWNVARTYGDRWTRFLNVIATVDPTGKFADEHHILRPEHLVATKAGRRLRSNKEVTADGKVIGDEEA